MIVDHISNFGLYKDLSENIDKAFTFKEMFVISPKDTSYFSMSRIEVFKEYKSIGEDVFSSAVILKGKGKGKLLWDDEELEVEQLNEIFLPASLGNLKWEHTGKEELIIVRCYPPG